MRLSRYFDRSFSEHAFFLFGIFLLKAVLDGIYVIYVHPIWAYSGFTLNVSGLRYAEGWLIYAMVIPALSPRLRKPSDCFVLILAAIVIAPMTSLYGLTDESRSAMYSVVAGYWIVCLFRIGHRVRVPTVRGGILIALLIASVATAAVLSWLIASGGYALVNFDIAAVYDFRPVQAEVIRQGVFSYLNVWVYKVFNVFLLSWALYHRRWIPALALILLQFFFFGVSNHKSIVLYPFIVLFIWYYFSRTRSLAIVPLGIAAIIVTSGLLWYFSNFGWAAALLVRRALFVIARNTFDYYEFFSTNVYVFWTNSFMSIFFEYPYHLNPPDLIGDWRGDPGHVNNTFLSTGYMHAGFVGVALYSMLVGILFRLVDSLSLQAGPVWFALAVTVIPMQHLLGSADLPTALLTHGIGVNLLLLFFARRRREALNPMVPHAGDRLSAINVLRDE